MRTVLLISLVLSLCCVLALPAVAQDQGPTEKVAILTTNQGDIVLRFFPDLAPAHVQSFLTHCADGYYTGTAFHRVIPGFMIQGGDPNSSDDDPSNDGMGGYSADGPGTTLRAEFSSRPHKRGILSMARTSDPDSAGSQFFIVQQDSFFLDNQYTVFGQVVAGMDVVDRIVNVPRDAADRPLEPQVIQAVTVEEWPVSKVEETLAAQE